MNGTRKLPAANDLASQIKESVSKNVRLVPVEQAQLRYCDGPEGVVEIFMDTIAKYPPAILQLPISTVLIEVSDDNAELSRKKLKGALQDLAQVIRSTLNDGDIVVKYGKEKYAVLLLNVDEVSAGKLCHRIKEAMHLHWFLKQKLTTHLTVEFAIAQHDLYGGNDFAEMIFGNEKNIHLARALGDGAIVTRTDAKEHFREHKDFQFRLGDELCSDIYEKQD